MMVPRHPHLGRLHLPLGVAASSGKIALIVATTTRVGATSLLQIVRSALEPLMLVPLHHHAVVMRQHQCRVLQRHHHLGRCHLPPEVAANSMQIAPIAATTTPVGATSLLQIATFVPEPSMPAPLRHRAMVMRRHQCRLLQHQCRLLQHRQRRRRHHRSQRHRRHLHSQ